MLLGQLSDHNFPKVMQARSRKAEYDPNLLAARSLRSGFLAGSAESGAIVWKMRAVSRQKLAQVLGGFL